MNVTAPAAPILRAETVRAFAGTRTTTSLVARPRSITECQEVLAQARRDSRTVLPRGSGYTYGDMILNAGHIVLDTNAMCRIRTWDAVRGIIVVEPGVQFRDVFTVALPAGWTLPACPGGMSVTIAGALSNNVHGKDAWRVGNFGDHVRAATLLTADGALVTIDRSDARFRAVPGSMGLLGVLVEITLQLLPVPSPFVEVTTTPSRSIAATVALLEASRETEHFAVAWVDAFARRPQLGRGFVTTARWITSDEVPARERYAAALAKPTRVFGLLPARPTWRCARPFFRPMGIRVANELLYRRASAAGIRSQVMLFTEYNFMHNNIPGLEQVYQPEGFLEFEPLVPRGDGVRSLEALLTRCQELDASSLLCAVKMHRADDYAVSYAGDGYSIGIDVALRGRSPAAVSRIVEAIFALTRSLGGIIYLGKDERLTRADARAMYPHADVLFALKRALDPDGRFASDMYRRLFVPV